MSARMPEHRLWSAHRELIETAVRTDLTHPFRPGQPHFPGFGDERRETVFSLDGGDGFTVHRYTLVGQWGTHVDPPSHFLAGARTLDQIPVEEMILPLVCSTWRIASAPTPTPRPPSTTRSRQDQIARRVVRELLDENVASLFVARGDPPQRFHLDHSPCSRSAGLRVRVAGS
ncbi:cyclase family protein [Streptomyces sp. F63]|uniref:cyclase family protein n=1 Tax=Streptomyces sp. F63 TaxID=2824887 RepID=UPI001FFCCCC9|nr:cyclase family protein [Streptomyces sp. F63]